MRVVKAFASPTPGRLGETNATYKTETSPLHDAVSGSFDGISVEELYRRHAAAAWGVANSVLRNPDDAADAVADAFTNVLRKAPSPAEFRPYLLAAARNAAIDIRRRARRSEPEDAVDRPDHREPVDRLVAQEDREAVAEAFARLPERWRSALWLIDVEQLSTEEAGTVLGVSANNAAQLATRARGRLREEFIQVHVPNHIRGTCGSVVVLLGRYTAGTASPRTRAKVEKHVTECPECAARLDAVGELGVKLRHAIPPLPVALQWRIGGHGRDRSRPRLAGLWDQAAAVALFRPSAASVVTHAVVASPVVERLAAGVTAAVLVLGVSAAALRSSDPAPPHGGSDRSVAAASLPAGARSAPATGPDGAPTAGASASAPSPPGSALPAAAVDVTANLPAVTEGTTGSAGASSPAAGLGPALSAVTSPLASSLSSSVAPALSSSVPPSGVAVPPASVAASVAPVSILPPPQDPVIQLPVTQPAPSTPTAPSAPRPNVARIGAATAAPVTAGAQLAGRVLRGTDLSGLDLRNADLRGADLRDADLSGADLRGADLRDADLRDANLAGADLRDTKMEATDFAGAVLGTVGSTIDTVEEPESPAPSPSLAPLVSALPASLPESSSAAPAEVVEIAEALPTSAATTPVPVVSNTESALGPPAAEKNLLH
jgi:RNA polymerase sigma factor (sigma-70 family)